jgi:hypothetical protein
MHQFQSKPNQTSTELPVQTNYARALQTSESIRETAIAGMQGANAALPHIDKIQMAFGHHNISNVQAFMGTNAQHAALGIGARAYAMGNKITFASNLVYILRRMKLLMLFSNVMVFSLQEM